MREHELREVDLLVRLVDEVTPVLGHVERLLASWSGEFPSSCPGAAPLVSSGFGAGGGPDDGVKMTKVEADASRPDGARQALERLERDVAGLLVECRRVVRSDVSLCAVSGRAGPVSTTVRRWAMVAVLVRAARDAGLSDRAAAPLARRARRVADACRVWRPVAPKVPSDGCRAHARVDQFAQVADRYRGLQLCLWCGEFRAMHRVDPPAQLVKLHDRGVKMSSKILEQHGIKALAARRRRR